MKNITKVIMVLTIVALSSMLMLNTVAAACNLPPSPVTLTVGAGSPPVTITLSGVPAGYDVTNGPYIGYCTELGVAVISPTSAMLECTDNVGSPWDEINYLLNTYPDSLDVQLAIWRLLGYSQTFIELGGWTYTANAESMYQDALIAGVGFDPMAGDWVGVRCIVEGAQDLLIKIQIPEEVYPGFTPGFWKHNIGVYLTSIDYDDVKVNGAPSAFEGGPLDGVKCDAAVLSVFDPGFLYDKWVIMNTGGGGATAQARADAANWFNDYFGYGPFED